jgi:hypothetical protein
LIGCCHGEEGKECNRCGMIGQQCDDCGPFQLYEDLNVPFGKCVSCGAEGEMYKKCVVCTDKTSTYEFSEK